MKKLLTIFLLAAIPVFAQLPEFLWHSPGKDGSFKLQIAGKNPLSIPGKIRIYNGKSKKYAPLRLLSQGKELVFAADDCQLIVRPEVRGKLLIFNNSLINTGKHELFLQPELVFTFPASGQDFFFNGYETLPVKKLPLHRIGLKGRPEKKLAGITQVFPAAGVIGPEYTLFAGQVPQELVSYHAAHLEAVGNAYRFTFDQRHAIGAGKKVDFKLIMGLTATRYGREQAMIQRIFDAFPELFGPVVGWDNPYIWGTEQYLVSYWDIPDYEAERRYHATLTWAFVPFKRAGDIYGEADLWDYKPLRPFKWWYNTSIAGKTFDYRNLSWEKFHAQRREVWNKYAKDFGYAFYNSAAGVWCEDQLAVQRYSDSIVDDTDKVKKYLSPWCTPWDQHVRVFSYGTSFGKKFRSDMKKVHAELGMPGFAFDCVTPGAYYRGPAAQDPDMPGRAWDAEGVFIDQSVAIIKLTDFVHEELPGTFVWLNGITGRGDCCMLEYGIFEDSFRSVMPLVRYNAGQIPMQTRGYGFNRFLFDYLPDWRNMSKEEFTAELQKLSVHLIFNYFQYGLTGTYNTANGCSLEQYIMPELLEVRKLGWQAQVPVSVDSDKLFYSARYGTGADTVIFMGNPYAENATAHAVVGNDILGKENYIFIRKMRDCAAAVNRIKGRTTELEVQLLSRLPVLYESICGLSIVPEKGLEVDAVVQKDLNAITYQLQFKNDRKFTTQLTPRRIADFELAEITVNGQKISGRNLTIPADGKVELKYRSKYFTFSKADLMQFPFAADNRNAALEIVLPQDANASELRQAERLKKVFDFLVKHKVLESSDIAIVRGKGTVGKPQIVITVKRSASTPQVSLNENVWQITAPDAAAADLLVRKFSYILDQKFEYIFPFQPRAWDGLHPDMLKYFDLAQDRLPLERCFENNGGN